MWARLLIGTIRSKVQHRPIVFTTASSTSSVQFVRRLCNLVGDKPQLKSWELNETRKRKRLNERFDKKWNKLLNHSTEEARTVLFSRLENCTTEEKINKCIQDFNTCGFKISEDYYLALLRAYTGSYLMHEAEKVLNDAESAEHINHDSLLRIKNYSICQMAPRRHIKAALAISDELGEYTSPEAAICLLHNLRSPGQLQEHLKLLGILPESEPLVWYEGHLNTVLYCLHNRMIRGTLEMVIKLHHKKFEINEILIQAFLILADTPDIESALQLFEGIKSRTEVYTLRSILMSLQTCAMMAKSRRYLDDVWTLYPTHNLPYNTSEYMLRFRALLKLGYLDEAEKLFNETISSLKAYKVKDISKVFNDISQSRFSPVTRLDSA